MSSPISQASGEELVRIRLQHQTPTSSVIHTFFCNCLNMAYWLGCLERGTVDGLVGVSRTNGKRGPKRTQREAFSLMQWHANSYAHLGHYLRFTS